MSEGPNRFYNSLNDAASLSERDLVGYFLYYLTLEAGQEFGTATAINECFIACDLTPPTRTARYLSEGVQTKKYVKAIRGYKLQRHHRDELATRLGAERIVVQASAELRRLEHSVNPGSAREFLKETIDCFQAGANRATVVMCWILVLDHLIDYTVQHHLPAFNLVLAANKDKRIKVSSITTRDDFAEIPEGRLIELLRSANVISSDVRKILDTKLGTRNSSAHPSGVVIKRTKVIDFVEDLLENVVLKYKI
jgi:hypothetical protein